jgi:tRNAThr (cytosine32-N3)-methyltransferase
MNEFLFDCHRATGTGSSIYPLLSTNANPKLQIKAYDYSAQAIKFVQANPMYSFAQMANNPVSSKPVVGSISASTWDITSPQLPPNLPEGSADIIILVFVLSALRPEEWAIAVNNIHKVNLFLLSALANPKSLLRICLDSQTLRTPSPP